MAYCSNCGQQLSDGANFCSNCGTRVKPVANNSSQRQTVYEGQLHKCPQCGDVVKSFEICCPTCGYEFRGTTATNSVKELARKLEQINSEKKNKGLWKALFEDSFMSSNAEKQVSLITSFAIPNTREDLWEFLILASTNIHTPSEISDQQNPSQKAISDAWRSKFGQAYHKAKLVFDNERELQKVEDLYNAKNNEIEQNKRKRVLSTVGILVLPFLLLVLMAVMLFLISWSDSSTIKEMRKENERLDSIVAEVYDYLEEGNYVLSRAKASALVFKYSNSSTSDDEKASAQWDKTREQLLEIIDGAEKGDGNSKVK